MRILSLYDVFAAHSILLLQIASDWEKLCLETLQRRISLWDEFYRNLFLDRVESLIEVRMNETSRLVVREIENPNLSNVDTFGFIWSEVGLNDASAVAKLGANNGSDANNNHHNQLSMKTKAFSPSIQEVCKKLNDSLQTLLNELYEYVGRVDKPASNIDPLAFLNDQDPKLVVASEPFSLTIDNETILKFAQKTCQESIEKMVAEIAKNENDRSATFVEVGRFFSAVPELCPAVQRCVEAPFAVAAAAESKAPRSVGSMRGGFPEWTSVKKILEEESARYYNLWIRQLVCGLRTDLQNVLTDNFAVDCLAEWESSEISEEAEDGTQVRSTIRVPQYISIGLHSALSAFVHRAHSAGPHALPPQVQLSLSQDAAAAVVADYFEYSEKRKLIQNVALQLHFDVQFLVHCVVSRDNRSLSTSAASTLSSLERHIDPFDLSVFSPFMSENVKRCVIRAQTIFGVLIPSGKK